MVTRSSLSDLLTPLLRELFVHTVSDEVGSCRAQEPLVRAWFEDHPECMPSSVEDAMWLLEQPNALRKLVTYPSLGNWVLDEIDTHPDGLAPSRVVIPPESRRHALSLARHAISLRRFANDHLRYALDPIHVALAGDALTAYLFAVPGAFEFLWDSYLHPIAQHVSDKVYKEIGFLPEYEGRDPGHGIYGPVQELTRSFLNPFIHTRDTAGVTPLDLTVMVVDDEHATEWQNILLLYGFKTPQAGGAYTNAIDALATLQRGTRADVLLTDVELGAGMSGIDLANAVLTLPPESRPSSIVVFSYNSKCLVKAGTDFEIRGVTNVHCIPKEIFNGAYFRNLVTIGKDS